MRQLAIMTLISSNSSSAFKDAATALTAGNLVAFPTETVYGLGADACNEDAVARIYEVKGRPKNHPLIVHISSVNNLAKWVREIPEYAIKLANEFWPGPITLILPRARIAKDFITGGQNSVGIRVPAHPLALLLLKEFESQGGLGIAAPSANRFGKVSPTCADDVKNELSSYLNQSDLILDGGSSKVGIESTIVECISSTPKILRPGAVTADMISSLLGTKIKIMTTNKGTKIMAPGLFESHYSPSALVKLTGTPAIGDGLIALSEVQTPPGVIRLAAPVNNDEYARILYQALRLGDQKKISKIYALPPTGDGIATAIQDRLRKSSGNTTKSSFT